MESKNIAECSACKGTGSDLYTGNDCSECFGTGLLIDCNTTNANEYINRLQELLGIITTKIDFNCFTS
jgi:DnaJ-class molecular chaperone